MNFYQNATMFIVGSKLEWLELSTVNERNQFHCWQAIAHACVEHNNGWIGRKLYSSRALTGVQKLGDRN